MSDSKNNYFVAAAVVAANLDQATKISQKLSLTASNARVVMLRAGPSAAGFRPLTDAIHRLADVTVSSSKKINVIAATLNATSVEMFRAARAVKYFKAVYQSVEGGSTYLHSLDGIFERIKTEYEALLTLHRTQVKRLFDELDRLDGELRAAIVLKTLCLTEASQAEGQYKQSFVSVSENVEGTVNDIKKLIKDSQQQVALLN